MKVLTNSIKPILALLIIIAGFGYFFTVTFCAVPSNDLALGAIISLMGGASQYYFGSSTGTAKKDEAIHELLKGKGNAS